MRTNPRAEAFRTVVALALTSTMATSEPLPKWLSFFIAGRGEVLPGPSRRPPNSASRATRPGMHWTRAIATTSPEPCHGRTETSGLPAHGLHTRRQKVSQFAALVNRVREARAENRQRPRLRAAEQIDRGNHKQLERDHRRDGIARQAEHRLAAANSENGRPARAGWPRNRTRTSCPIRRGPVSTRSYFPIETPPEIISRSAFRPRSMRRRSSFFSSGAFPRESLSAPVSPAKASMATLLPLRTCKGPGVAEMSTTSSPVERMAARGRLKTLG